MFNVLQAILCLYIYIYIYIDDTRMTHVYLGLFSKYEWNEKRAMQINWKMWNNHKSDVASL